METHEFVTTEEYVWVSGPHTKILPTGSFVRPIEEGYVPKHVIEGLSTYQKWAMYDNTGIFCYTSIGLILIPRKIVRQIK